ADFGGPEQAAVLGIESHQEFVIALAPHDENTAASNRRSRVAAAQAGRLPENFWALLRPRLEQAGFRGHAGPVRSAPAWPIAGSCKRDRPKAGQDNRDKFSGSHHFFCLKN